MIKVGYMGPKGTFSQQAIRSYMKDKSNIIECEFGNIHEVITNVNNGQIDEGVVPIENSLEGAVNATMDTLATDVQLLIKGEVVIHVAQNLMLKEGSRIEDIKVIASHPQPIGQCRNYLNARFPNVTLKYTLSTAEAAIEVAKSQGEMAAIGSVIAAEEYGLQLHDRNIQDGNNNMTRFVIISKKDAEITGNDKTSIVFTTEDKPGSLSKVLDIFNLWDINMTRIESRPSKNKFGEYIFFLDISGHREDEDVKNALTMVKRKSSYYKFLGSYPAYRMG